MENIKVRVRPYYEELKGLLAQLPPPNDSNRNCLGDFEPASHLNQVISALNALSTGNYDRFCFPPEILPPGEYRIPDTLSLLRVKTSALIMHLYGKFYSDEPEPFSGHSQTINLLTATLYLYIGPRKAFCLWCVAAISQPVFPLPFQGGVETAIPHKTSNPFQSKVLFEEYGIPHGSHDRNDCENY